ncbi:MAG TPA: hypothetical protein VIG25_10070 [Pyrinomonadaceae bacterium]
MTKHGFIRLTVISACVAALLAVIALTPAAGKAPMSDNASEKISLLPLHPITMGVIGSDFVPTSGTELIRGKDRVFISITTKNLMPGWVYTAWLGIFNNPELCATHPCSGADFANPAVEGSRVNCGGRIIGLDGSATYGSVVTLGDTTSAFDGPGLLDPAHSEIHVVVRSHGPALMGMVLADQLSKFNGGCPPNTCVNVQIAMHRPPSSDK